MIEDVFVYNREVIVRFADESNPRSILRNEDGSVTVTSSVHNAVIEEIEEKGVSVNVID